MMDQWPGYQQVLTLAPPAIESLAGPDCRLNWHAWPMSGWRTICQRWPDKFPAFVAAIPFNNVAAAIEEIDRSIGALGARGIHMFTNVRGRPPMTPNSVRSLSE